MSNNSTFRSIFKYLIVIIVGILVYIQVSNWREGRMAMKEDLSTLYSLSDILASHKQILEVNTQLKNDIFNSIRAIEKAGESKQTYNDSIGIHLRKVMSWEPMNLDMSFVENLTTKRTLPYDDINNLALDYVQKYNEIKDIEEQVIAPFYSTVVMPFSNENFVANTQNNSLTPNDYERLKSQDNYENTLELIKQRNSAYLQSIQTLDSMNADMDEAINLTLDTY